MSSWFAGPRPSHAADPKVKENTKKENAKKENALFFPGGRAPKAPDRGGRKGRGSRRGRERGAGSSVEGADRVCAKTFQNAMPQFLWICL